MERLEAPTPASLAELQELLKIAFEEDRVNVEYINDLLSNYKSNPRDWKKYAKFDRFKYTRNLVDAGNGKYNLMILCWPPSKQSTIHDHSDAHCFMKMLDGTLEEFRYQWPDGSDVMKSIGQSKLNMNEVLYINDSMGLHRVGNLSQTEEAVSMHLYCPPFQECRIFDENTSQSTKCPVTFWSIEGKKVSKKTPT